MHHRPCPEVGGGGSPSLRHFYVKSSLSVQELQQDSVRVHDKGEVEHFLSDALYKKTSGYGSKFALVRENESDQARQCCCKRLEAMKLNSGVGAAAKRVELSPVCHVGRRRLPSLQPKYHSLSCVKQVAGHE